jgi:hypothetical protein
MTSSSDWKWFIVDDGTRIIACRMVAGQPVALDLSWNGTTYVRTDLTIRSSDIMGSLDRLKPLAKAMRYVEDLAMTRH